MFWITKKKFKITMQKVYRDVVRIFKEIQELKLNSISKKEFEQLHKQLHEATTPTTTRSTLGSMQKRVLRRLDSIKLMKAIQGYIKDGYSTSQVRDEIMNRFDIGTTCFYKYLKEVRQQLREATTPITKRSRKNK